MPQKWVMAKHTPELPVVEQDPTEESFVGDPYPFYARLRALGSFVFWKDYDMAVATTHAAVSQVLRHPSMGRAKIAQVDQKRPC